MYSYSKCGSSDSYKALFSSFFMRYREHFSPDMSLDDALVFLLTTAEQSSFVLTYNEQDQLIAAMNYWRTASEQFEHDPAGPYVYISSALIDPKERSKRVFMHGFRDFTNEVHRQDPNIKMVMFTALADIPYINKLYSKLARLHGQQEGTHGVENIYYADFEELRAFLNRLKSKNV